MNQPKERVTRHLERRTAIVCHPERSEGPAFARIAKKKQILLANFARRGGGPRACTALGMTISLVLFAAMGVAAQQKKEQQSAKPKVRAITAFVRIERDHYQPEISEAIQFLKLARTTFESRGFIVQTIRIATQPFPEYTQGMSRDQAIQFFKNLDGLAQQEHVMLSIGPAYLAGKDGDAQATLLADILQNTKSIYGSVYVTGGESVNWPAVRAAARVMKTLSDGTAHSEGNFHFAALANVPQTTPFFPAAYLTGMGHQFSVGLELPNSLIASVKDAPALADAHRRMVEAFFNQSSDAEHLGLRISSERGWIYLGQDLSPAPSKDASIGALIEALSKQPFGSTGTLTAVATITSALKQIGLRKTGYSGLMLPILEDPVLAERWNAGLVSLDALVSYSAVCGTGLDTVPLPGDVTVEQLARIIGDVASLSVRWNKPLSARLLPVAGRLAGQQTDFTDPNLLNGVIQPLSGPEPKQ